MSKFKRVEKVPEEMDASGKECKLRNTNATRYVTESTAYNNVVADKPQQLRNGYTTDSITIHLIFKSVIKNSIVTNEGGAHSETKQKEYRYYISSGAFSF